jgi:hypothetical protein
VVAAREVTDALVGRERTLGVREHGHEDVCERDVPDARGSRWPSRRGRARSPAMALRDRPAGPTVRFRTKRPLRGSVRCRCGGRGTLTVAVVFVPLLHNRRVPFNLRRYDLIV